MTLAIVERVEDDGDRALVFAEREDGVKVSFHLPKAQAALMRVLLEQGQVVAVDLPAPKSGPMLVVSQEVVEVRKPRQN